MTRNAQTTRACITNLLDYWLGRPLLDVCRRGTGKTSRLSEEDKALMHDEMRKGMKKWFGAALTEEEKRAVDQNVRDEFQSTLLHFAERQFPLISAEISRHKSGRGDREKGNEGAEDAGNESVDVEALSSANVWTEDARSLLAAIILCDQFPRHIYRGQPDSFAFDSIALDVAQYMVAEEYDMALHPLERMWVYMPFEHSENMDHQRQCMELFQKLEKSPSVQENGLEETAKLWIKYADVHLVMIEKFGRFPHRNVILGRESTKEELEHLGSSQSFI